MKKVLSRFLIFVLLALIALLLVSGTMYFLKHMDKTSHAKNSANGIEIFPSMMDRSADYSRIDSESLSSYDKENGRLSTRGYDALTDENEKYLYECLSESIYRISDEMDEQGKYKTGMVEVTGAELDSGRINTAINAFLYDNPQIFWLDNYFGYSVSDNTTYVECYSVLSGNQCEIYIKRFNEAIEKMLSVIEADDGKYEREMKLHDKLLEKCSYDHNVQSIEDGWEKFSAYGAIVDGSAVCEGYSKAMMILLNLSGVDAVTVRGEGENERHMWNLVEIGGNWYHLDATWDDDENEIIHDFFNLTDEMIKSDHITDPLLGDEVSAEDFSYNFFLPECKSLDMNFYNIEGLIVTSLGEETDNAISNLLYNKALAGEDRIYFQVTGELSFEEFNNYLLDNGGERFMALASGVNEYLESPHRINTSSCNTLKNMKRSTLRIKVYYE